MSKKEILKRINARAVSEDTNLNYQKVAESFRNQSKGKFTVTQRKKIIMSAQEAINKLIEMYEL